MLINNLRSIMKNKKVTIKDIVLGTTLSRNTLSNIVNNPKANIANSTLDILCLFLEITPSDFYEYHNFSFLPVIDINFDDSEYNAGVLNYPINMLIQIIQANNKVVDEIKLIGTGTDILQGGFADQETSILLNFENENQKKKFKNYSEKLSKNAYSAFLEYLKQELCKEMQTDISPKSLYFDVKSQIISTDLVESSISNVDSELARKALDKIRSSKTNQQQK